MTSAAGTADEIVEPLPGTNRLISMLARLGYGVLPARVYETDRLTVRFGCHIPTKELLSAPAPAELAMRRVADLRT